MITITIPEKLLGPMLQSKANKDKEENGDRRRIIIHTDNKKIGGEGDIVGVNHLGYFTIIWVHKGCGAAGFCRVIDNNGYFIGCNDNETLDEYGNTILNTISAPGTFPPETYLYALEEVFGLDEILGPVRAGIWN